MNRTRNHRLLALAGVAALLLPLTLVPSLRAHSQAYPQGRDASPSPLTSTWIDNFDGPPLNSRWSWMNEDPTHWSLTENSGFLRIITQQENNNYLVQDAPVGDYEIETHVLIEPTQNFQVGGLSIYLDDNNRLTLARAYCDLGDCIGNAVYYDVVVNGMWYRYMLETTVEDEIWLKVVRQGITYTGYASENGTEWTEVGAPSVGFAPGKIGLRAGNQGQNANEIPADFDYFALVDDSYLLQLPLVMSTSLPLNLTLWHNWSGDYLVEYEAVIYEYTQAHPNVSVTLFRPDDMTSALAEAIPAGTGPDFVSFSNDPIGRWAASGFLTPLDPWIDLEYLQDNFEPAAAQAMVWQDHVWGIPDWQEGIALVYNRDLIEEAQLPAPGDWAGLTTQAAQFQQSHPDKYYLCNQALGNPDAYHVAPIYFGHGMSEYGGYVDEDGNVYMTTPEALAAAQWIADFRPYAPGHTSHDICKSLIIDGQAAIWWTGPWAIADLLAAGIDYGIAPMGSPFVYVRNYMLTPNAVDRGYDDAAMSVMQYLGSAEVQARLALANGTIPANTAALNDPDVQAVYDVAHFGESVHLGTPMGNHVYTNCQWGPVGDATTAIWVGALTPEEAMATAQAEMEACVGSMPPR